MSATNSTQHYKLPLFTATDKPTWQGDWNSAMSALDTAIYDASQTGSGESGSGSDAAQALVTANEALVKANQAISQSQTADSKATQALSTASGVSSTVSAHGSSISQLNKDVSALQGDITTLTTASQQNSKDIITSTQLASTAKTTADTAKSTADTAKTTADAAKTAAAQAQTDANTAKTNASTALTNASTAQTGVNNLQTRVTELENADASTSVLAVCQGLPNISYVTAPSGFSLKIIKTQMTARPNNTIINAPGFLLEFDGGCVATSEGVISFWVPKSKVTFPSLSNPAITTHLFTDQGFISTQLLVSVDANFPSSYNLLQLDIKTQSNKTTTIYGVNPIIILTTGEILTT